MMLDNRDTCDAINDLIDACQCSIAAQLDAADTIVGNGQREYLVSLATQRRGFADDLGRVVTGLGGRPLSRQPASTGWFGRLVHRGQAFMVGENDGDTYGTCSRVETRTELRYDRALAGSLPADVRRLVEVQRKSVATDGADLRRRKFIR